MTPKILREVGIDFEDVLAAESNCGCYEGLGLHEVVQIGQVTPLIPDFLGPLRDAGGKLSNELSGQLAQPCSS
jgi:hypothetical protein